MRYPILSNPADLSSTQSLEADSVMKMTSGSAGGHGAFGIQAMCGMEVENL